MKHWIIGAIIILLVFYIYTLFNGTPWGKESMREQSEKYLHEKYGDEMEIKVVEYDFDNSFYFEYIYYTVVQLKKNPQVQIRIIKNDGDD